MDLHSEDKVHSWGSGSSKSFQITRVRMIRRRKHGGRGIAESVCEHVLPSGVPVYFPEQMILYYLVFQFIWFPGNPEMVVL